MGRALDILDFWRCQILNLSRTHRNDQCKKKENGDISHRAIIWYKVLANIELNRTMNRRVGGMERTAWWVIGTRTEVERQELSGGTNLNY